MNKMIIRWRDIVDFSSVYLPDKNNFMYWIAVDKERKFIVELDDHEFYFELYERDGVVFYGLDIAHNVGDNDYLCPYCHQEASLPDVSSICPALSKNIKEFVEFFKTKSDYRLRALNELGRDILPFDEAFKRLGFLYDEDTGIWIEPMK